MCTCDCACAGSAVLLAFKLAVPFETGTEVCDVLFACVCVFGCLFLFTGEVSSLSVSSKMKRVDGRFGETDADAESDIGTNAEGVLASVVAFDVLAVIVFVVVVFGFVVVVVVAVASVLFAPLDFGAVVFIRFGCV